MRNRLRSFLSHGKKGTDEEEEAQKTQRPKNENVKCAAKWFEWACGALASIYSIIRKKKKVMRPCLKSLANFDVRFVSAMRRKWRWRLVSGFRTLRRGCKLATMEQYTRRCKMMKWDAHSKYEFRNLEHVNTDPWKKNSVELWRWVFRSFVVCRYNGTPDASIVVNDMPFYWGACDCLCGGRHSIFQRSPLTEEKRLPADARQRSLFGQKWFWIFRRAIRCWRHGA